MLDVYGRIIYRFLFLPKTINGKTKFLCFAKIFQIRKPVNRWSMGGQEMEWFDERWLDEESD